jgi:hypothetical protein
VPVTADGDQRTAPNTESGADPAPGEPYTLGKVAAYPAKLFGDMALNVAVGPAEAAAQDAALNNGQVSRSDPIAGALNGVGNGGFGRIRKVNSGDEPLDMAVKQSQEFLGTWPQGVKNALWPGAGQPSGTSDHSGPPSQSSAPAPPHAPSPTPSTHSGGSDSEGVGTWYSSGPSSPASSIHSASTQEGLPGLDGESGPPVQGPFAADHPVPPAPAPTSDVLTATPDTLPSAVQPPVVSPDQGDTPLLPGVQSPPGLPGVQMASGLPPSLSVTSTPGSITDGDVDPLETTPGAVIPAGKSTLPIGPGQGGRPAARERDGDDDSSEGLPGL